MPDDLTPVPPGHANDRAFQPMDRDRMAVLDTHFAADFIRLPGSSTPISRTLAHMLGVPLDDIDLEQRARLYADAEREIDAGDDARGAGGDD